jgi:hypothetical protein
MFDRCRIIRWPLMLVALAAIGMIMTSSVLAQTNVPVRPAVQVTVDPAANPIRTAELTASDKVQAKPVRWGWGWGGYRSYAPYRAYYPARYYYYYYPAPYYTYYYGTPYSTYYSAPYYGYYPRTYSYGPRVAVQPYARFWW